MNIVPDIAAIVDREWYGADPKPSDGGFVERVIHVPPEQRGDPRYFTPRPRYWQVVIGGRRWGIRPSDPDEQLLLDMFTTHFTVGPYAKSTRYGGIPE